MEGDEENNEVSKKNRYEQIIEWVFARNYDPVKVKISFARQELESASSALGFARMKNLGDIPYSFRFRRNLPESIQNTAPAGHEWIILGAGIGLYEFRLASLGKAAPSENRHRIKVPDATPEIVRYYAPGNDEQALLARARYNRLVDIFTGITCYSVQNHLRTTVEGIGQVEIDEIYVGINRRGTHFVIPCQAKSANDRFGIAQVIQDIELCRIKYPNALCKPIAIQFVGLDSVAMLELAVAEVDEMLTLNIVEEKHYQLIPRTEIDDNELQQLLMNEP